MFVLSEGSIKQQFAKGLAAAVLLSAVGATTASAQTLGPLSDALNATIAPNATSSPINPSTNPFSTTAVESVAAGLPSSAPAEANSSEKDLPLALAVNDLDSDLDSDSDSGLNSTLENGASDELIPSLNSDILIHAHAVDGRQAATLYIKNIPVLTFIGTEVDSLSHTGDVVTLASSDPSVSLQTAAPARNTQASQETDPVVRATSLGNQLDSDTIDATDISVRWNEETKGYTVTLADADLISLDNRTILADTTEDPAEDALQVTNRLRRLIGSAEPVSEIEGLPEPPAAPAQTVAIVSSNVGGASWYGPGFDGRLSASGEVFNQNALTAAHRTLPFGTRVMVTNLNNGRQVMVRINDRGPYSGSRIIDLSAGAAAEIGLINSGVATVQIDVLAN